MRFVIALSLPLLLLSACTETDHSQTENHDSATEEQTGEQNETTDPSQEIKEDEEPKQTKEMTETERLIRQLPEDADAEDWNLILVNPWHALPEDYEVEMEEVENQQKIDARIVDAWNEWNQAALEAGHRLFFASGYRTVDRQETNFNNSLQEYLNEGLSEEEALKKTKEYLTEPGHSEHHTGLALDIVDEEWIVEGYGLIPEYDTQASQQWLVDTMDDYGFILRYPKGKEELTGIEYESWHFRYVGAENAQFMVEHDLVLEEYIDLLNKREEFE